MVGRSDLLRDLQTGLESGPRDERYTSILLGSRGSGKTATLNAVEEHAQKAGWLVMSVDASTGGLPERIIQAVAWARDYYEGAETADPDAEHRGGGYSVRLPPGLGLGVSRPAPARPDWDMRHHLAGLASHAADLGSGVLLTVDEVHAGDREEIRRLAGDLQHVTKRDQMPLAFLAAGLSVLDYTLLSDMRMTFFQRCARFTMPPLTLAEAAGGLSRTVRLGGGRIEDDALMVAAEATGPLPYKLQLVGHHAWSVSAAPDEPINLSNCKLAGDPGRGGLQAEDRCTGLGRLAPQRPAISEDRGVVGRRRHPTRHRIERLGRTLRPVANRAQASSAGLRGIFR